MAVDDATTTQAASQPSQSRQRTACHALRFLASRAAFSRGLLPQSLPAASRPPARRCPRPASAPGRHPRRRVSSASTPRSMRAHVLHAAMAELADALHQRFRGDAFDGLLRGRVDIQHEHAVGLVERTARTRPSGGTCGCSGAAGRARGCAGSRTARAPSSVARISVGWWP